VRRAISAHRTDFAAIGVLILAAIAVSTYILEHQPSFVFGQSYYTVRAPFATAAAVTSGQGQAVTIAGVQVGQVGGVSLHNGQAIVTMNIYKQYAPIYRNATVLLRPRTPLKDMYLELDPGTRGAGRVPAGGMLSADNTQPDVDLSEILSSLDSDTRNYLILLLSAGAQAFHNPGAQGTAPSASAVADLRGTLKRFEPLDRDTKRFAALLATRQANIRRAIHNLNLVTNAFGGVEGELTSLINASDTNFSAIAANDVQLQQTLTEFPPTLQQSIDTLNKVRGFAAASTTTLTQLQPFARNLGPALKASRPLFHDTTPVIANQLRPFSVAVQPLARTLAAGAPKLKTTIPALTSSISVLNTLFNELAHEPPSGQQSYLFWGSWLAHIAGSLVSAQDANGAVLQGIFMNTCAGLNFYENELEPSSEPLGVILDLLNAPDVSKLPGVTPSPIAGQVTCPTSP
jgi:phospholipid/cholesterol/gamma-HCH transport system substrate-binding protein